MKWHLWPPLLLLACNGANKPAAGDGGHVVDSVPAPDTTMLHDGRVADSATLTDSTLPTDRAISADSAAPADSATPTDSAMPADSAAPQPCTTRITYGSSWLHGPNHPLDYDDAQGLVTWDGACALSGGNATATLSNGWQPVFEGKDCVIAFDYHGDCQGVPAGCDTRVGYGQSWSHGPSHPLDYDDVSGVVSWDGICHADGANSWAELSNGWKPYFTGSSGCDLAFRYRQCGGLFANPVVSTDCPDPGVLKDGDTYYMVCTGAGYPLRRSQDLVHWTHLGTIFDSNNKPTWASTNFWAPEMHKVGSRYVVYFSARQSSNSVFAVGAAWANSPTGPFTDIGQPLVTEPAPGAIDAHYFKDAASGKHYVLWKVDGNAVGQSTPIKIQELAANGLSLVGSPTTLIQNSLSWEGVLVEGPWMIARGGYYYLFYSANGYASTTYGVGVARASSPLGPFTKGSKILGSKGAWAGPGHGSVIRGPSGDWVHVYHAWIAGQVGQSPGRLVLVDRLQWANGWPLMRGAPSSRSQPLP